MDDRQARISRENVQPVANPNGRISETPFTRRPPIVSKVDGRARILRPLRVVTMQSNQQHPTTSAANGTPGTTTAQRPSSGGIPHSQSMPVLQAGVRTLQPNIQQPAARPILTLPSNTTEKNAVPLLQWVDALRKKLVLLRAKSQAAMEDSLKEVLTEEEILKTREALTEVANIYHDMNRTATVKCRLNAIFDKRGFYKSVENSLQDLKVQDINAYALYDRMQESLDERTAIDKNILCLNETFRRNPAVQPRSTIFSAPPPIKFSKHLEDANKGFLLAIDAVINRTRGEPMSWKFKRISHRCFRNAKSLVEVQYATRRPTAEKDFVTCMKALLILRFGILEDLIIGGEDETLYDTEKIYPSKRKVYKEFTNSAKEIILGSPVTKFTQPGNVVQCNNYIQMYVNCFTKKCAFCKKYLRQFMPPTYVTRELEPLFCHKLCLLSQVP
ncbi:Protein CBR-MDT-27 [Caenorhabditis briggsae]|uniref:Protein CBR-MDT-27 n=1 Tax=Caenorhabditis briggsae TaxID=6238 RepID=A8XV48_CAEBR|nr:Protein CBR-MDT-27 [Caenorhabditis briggsae]CAP36515.1 Protein CBR-MDT-27 [Caenorhabditis briggsae]